MDIIRFEDAETYEPEDGWFRASLAGNKSISVEYYEKPPGHSSPMHEHENDQVTIVIKGRMKVYTEDEEVVLEEKDSVFLKGGEVHRIENIEKKKSVGIDIFVPGRSFDFWTKRSL